MLPPPPKLFLWLCLLASLAAAAIAARLGLASILEVAQNGRNNQAWILLVFQVVVIIGAAFGVLTGLGRFRTGPALAMLCTGAVFFVTGTLGEPAIPSRLMGNAIDPMVLNGNVAVKNYALAQLGCGLIIFALSALTVIVRNPKRSFWYLWRAGLAMIPVAACVFLLRFPAGVNLLAKLPIAPLIIVKVLAMFVVIAFIAIAGHCIIRAFEAGRTTEIQRPPAA